MKAALRALVCAGCALSCSAALAQPPPDAGARARAHFERGLSLFDEERYEAALIEFDAAYELEPSYRLLYNIGNVHAALGRAVEAVDALERYLAEGGERIDRRRRREVSAMLETQRGRVGRVMVRASVDGATVTVDGVDRATTPLAEPIALSVGSYVIGVRAPGFEGETRRVDVAGQSEQTVELALARVEERLGTLRIEAGLDGVEVTVDGQAVGRTPLDRTVPVAEGRHVIEARRPGYAPARVEIEVQHGMERAVAVELERDPAAGPDVLSEVRLVLPDAPRAVVVDDEEVAVDGDRLELPIGAHAVEIRVDGREPHRERIELAPREAIELRPSLRWTAAERRALVEDAESRRTLGLVVGIGGVLLTVAALPVFIWNEMRLAQQDDIRPVWECATGMDGVICDDIARDLGLGSDADGLRQQYDWVEQYGGPTRIASLAGLVLGSAATVLGGWLHFGAPTEAEIDAGASARLVIGPGGLALTGTF